MRNLIKVNALVTLLDREAQILADENFHASSVTVGLAAHHMRAMAATMRAHGFDPDDLMKAGNCEEE
ncbi:hypothetical protein WG907_04425 [Sphingobium sp. AN558]|uniref:hypothetical protein n=1 Tax=Sphingobium sp. AN558 TaxID=3133442 RepID=UPI0030C17371